MIILVKGSDLQHIEVKNLIDRKLQFFILKQQKTHVIEYLHDNKIKGRQYQI